MKIRIVIPVLNQISYLTQCLTSIRETAPQKNHHTFVHVIDNGSTDAVIDAMHNLDDDTKPLLWRLTRNENNLGVTVPWNQGLRLAMDQGADVICISNSDVIYGPEVIEHCAQVAAKFGACFPLSIQGGPLPLDFMSRALKASEQNPLSSLVDTGGFAGWNFWLSRETVEKIGDFDEQFTLWYQDTDYHWRLRTSKIIPFEVRSCLIHHFESVTIKAQPGQFEMNGWRRQDEINWKRKWKQ